MNTGRRNFIKTATAAIAGLSLTPRNSLAASTASALTATAAQQGKRIGMLETG
jgi:hypothetical protein